MELPAAKRMIVVRGDGRIFSRLDEKGVIEKFKEAKNEGDRFASVIGWSCAGYETYAVLEKKAGYKGASYNQCLQSLQRMSRRI